MTEADPVIIEPMRGPRKSAKIAFKCVCWPKGVFPKVEAQLARNGIFAVPVEYPADCDWERVVTSARDIQAERLIAQKLLRKPVIRPSDHKVVRIEWLETVVGGAR